MSTHLVYPPLTLTRVSPTRRLTAMSLTPVRTLSTPVKKGLQEKPCLIPLKRRKRYFRPIWFPERCYFHKNKSLKLWDKKQIYEPPRDKTNKKACAPSEDSDQPGHPPSLIRVFAVRMLKTWVLSYPLSAQRRLWSDWADAQADLSLRWAHSHFVGFVMRWLVCIQNFIPAKWYLFSNMLMSLLWELVIHKMIWISLGDYCLQNCHLGRYM